MEKDSAPAHLDEIERRLCRKCRHLSFESNPNHWGNFQRLIDKGGWLPLFYLLLDCLMSRENHLWDPDSLVAAIMRSNEQRLIVCAVLFSTRELEDLGLTIPEYNRAHSHVEINRKEQVPLAFEHDIFHRVGVHKLSDDKVRTQAHVILFVRASKAVTFPGLDCRLMAQKVINASNVDEWVKENPNTRLIHATFTAAIPGIKKAGGLVPGTSLPRDQQPKNPKPHIFFGMQRGMEIRSKE